MNKYTLVDVKPAGKFAVELNSENAVKFALKMGDDMKQFGGESATLTAPRTASANGAGC